MKSTHVGVLLAAILVLLTLVLLWTLDDVEVRGCVAGSFESLFTNCAGGARTLPARDGPA
jgi:hypothetical protein